MASLGESLPIETARVRKLIVQYTEIGPAGKLAVAILEQALQRTDRAMISGDVVGMINAYEELKRFKE